MAVGPFGSGGLKLFRRPPTHPRHAPMTLLPLECRCLFRGRIIPPSKGNDEAGLPWRLASRAIWTKQKIAERLNFLQDTRNETVRHPSRCSPRSSASSTPITVGANILTHRIPKTRSVPLNGERQKMHLVHFSWRLRTMAVLVQSCTTHFLAPAQHCGPQYPGLAAADRP